MNNVESTCSQQGFEILHSVANRVRLRALDTKTKDKLTAIAQHLRTIAGIESVRINQDTGSLVITYDQNQLSRAQVQQLFEPYGVTQETPSPELTGADTYNQTLKRLTSLIPPVVGLAAVRGLGIVGWQGFAAYMVATQVTRGLMNQFESPSSKLAEKKLPLETTNSSKPAHSNYQVIHEIPGRIRLSFKKVKQDLDLVKKLENLTQWDNRITSVRVNPEAETVVINYRTATPLNTGQIPLNAAELIALIELITEHEADLKNPSIAEILNPEKVIPQETENRAIDHPESVKQKGQEKSENVIEQTETDSTNVLGSELVSEEDENNPQAPSEPKNQLGENASSVLDESEPLVSSTKEPPADSSDEKTINSIESAPDAERFELSEYPLDSPWRRFKACMLNTMLRLMVNFPLQQA
ncbi:HMA2 domain-containing protein [Gloeothece verrucosa]|uniref:Heavy metal translocating P-type ATPase n=1 Tax=Gloeothece verrucosa (strain PCC 7822) TaxID=497965 RepID=E0U920_GLOV7|nr:hypothetical protein [Gloeothece verrucosa]ADN16159.1 hypothetical protein Cyan7822_4241 [Gloeothece verrucosa PCC 7822]